MTYRCVRQENRRDLMTKQPVVVRRKMDTPIAVVATLGIELTMFSFCSELPAVKKNTHKPFKDVRQRAWRTNQGQAFGISGWARFTSFDSDSMTQTFSEGFTCITEKSNTGYFGDFANFLLKLLVSSRDMFQLRQGSERAEWNIMVFPLLRLGVYFTTGAWSLFRSLINGSAFEMSSSSTFHNAELLDVWCKMESLHTPFPVFNISLLFWKTVNGWIAVVVSSIQDANPICTFSYLVGACRLGLRVAILHADTSTDGGVWVECSRARRKS